MTEREDGMLKGIGGVMIFSGCLGLGLWYREQFIGRIRALRMLCGILDLFTSQVRYGRAMLPECCHNVAAQLEPPLDQVFQTVASRMQENTGASFARVFREQLTERLEEMPLTPDDREIFFQFISETGYLDGQMQLRVMEQSGEQLAGTAGRLEKESSEKCRMALGLGIMSGLLLILVLW